MKNRKLLVIIPVSVVILAFILSSLASGSVQKVGAFPAVKQDFWSGTGEKILEVVDASYELSATGLENSSVTVRNLSGRNITAMGLIWTAVYANGSKDSIEQTVDTRISQSKPFAPNRQRTIPRLIKNAFSNERAIEGMRVEFSFAEFEDATIIGDETSWSYRQVLAQRRGAAIYKRFVEESYANDPKNIARLAAKVSSDDLPLNKELEDSDVKMGAEIYRNWMRSTLKAKGETGLLEYIQRPKQK
jgi:hypothetical protein